MQVNTHPALQPSNALNLQHIQHYDEPAYTLSLPFLLTICYSAQVMVTLSRHFLLESAFVRRYQVLEVSSASPFIMMAEHFVIILTERRSHHKQI
eukprot:m.14522 g.14522  ORF g.14522 m.14522 type:complete len:95 (+) comp10299_c0_seq1:221-505(+)